MFTYIYIYTHTDAGTPTSPTTWTLAFKILVEPVCLLNSTTEQSVLPVDGVAEEVIIGQLLTRLNPYASTYCSRV